MGKFGKFAHFNPKDPRPAAQCDLTGMLGMYDDLVWDQNYQGNSLVKTGFKVLKRFANQPNPQRLAPLVIPDPIVVDSPRPSPYLTEPD